MIFIPAIWEYLQTFEKSVKGMDSGGDGGVLGLVVLVRNWRRLVIRLVESLKLFMRELSQRSSVESSATVAAAAWLGNEGADDDDGVVAGCVGVCGGVVAVVGLLALTAVAVSSDEDDDEARWIGVAEEPGECGGDSDDGDEGGEATGCWIDELVVVVK